MSNRISDRNRVPKGGYSYQIPESQRWFYAHTPGRLFSRVREYQAANNYHVSSDEEIEEDYCKRNPHHCDDGSDKTWQHTDLLTQVAAAVGIPAADALAKLSSKLGVKCATCSKRHGIIRRIRELGIGEAVRQLKETL